MKNRCWRWQNRQSVSFQLSVNFTFPQLRPSRKMAPQMSRKRADPGIELQVGPYALYGALLVKVCAENGVHYVDLCGELPLSFCDSHCGSPTYSLSFPSTIKPKLPSWPTKSTCTRNPRSRRKRSCSFPAASIRSPPTSPPSTPSRLSCKLQGTTSKSAKSQPHSLSRGRRRAGL